MINVNVRKLVDIPDINLDLTKQLTESAKIIGEEIRGNIKRGTNIKETSSHRLNAPAYRKFKIQKLGEGRPLVAEHKKLIAVDSYPIKKIEKNHVRLSLSNSPHPGSSATIAEIGAYNNFGTNRIPAREFWGVSTTAVKRVIALITKTINDLVG